MKLQTKGREWLSLAPGNLPLPVSHAKECNNLKSNLQFVRKKTCSPRLHSGRTQELNNSGAKNEGIRAGPSRYYWPAQMQAGERADEGAGSFWAIQEK
jgi:hypothetical protein